MDERIKCDNEVDLNYIFSCLNEEKMVILSTNETFNHNSDDPWNILSILVRHLDKSFIKNNLEFVATILLQIVSKHQDSGVKAECMEYLAKRFTESRKNERDIILSSAYLFFTSSSEENLVEQMKLLLNLCIDINENTIFFLNLLLYLILVVKETYIASHIWPFLCERYQESNNKYIHASLDILTAVCFKKAIGKVISQQLTNILKIISKRNNSFHKLNIRLFKLMWLMVIVDDSELYENMTDILFKELLNNGLLNSEDNFSFLEHILKAIILRVLMMDWRGKTINDINWNSNIKKDDIMTLLSGKLLVFDAPKNILNDADHKRIKIFEFYNLNFLKALCIHLSKIPAISSNLVQKMRPFFQSICQFFTDELFFQAAKDSLEIAIKEDNKTNKEKQTLFESTLFFIFIQYLYEKIYSQNQLIEKKEIFINIFGNFLRFIGNENSTMKTLILLLDNLFEISGFKHWYLSFLHKIALNNKDLDVICNALNGAIFKLSYSEILAYIVPVITLMQNSDDLNTYVLSLNVTHNGTFSSKNKETKELMNLHFISMINDWSCNPSESVFDPLINIMFQYIEKCDPLYLKPVLESLKKVCDWAVSLSSEERLEKLSYIGRNWIDIFKRNTFISTKPEVSEIIKRHVENFTLIYLAKFSPDGMKIGSELKEKLKTFAKSILSKKKV